VHAQEKRAFILKALESCRDKLDKFLSYMPKDKVKAARDQVSKQRPQSPNSIPNPETWSPGARNPNAARGAEDACGTMAVR
jgi:hypothetical protein